MSRKKIKKLKTKSRSANNKTKREVNVAWYGLLSAIGQVAYISMVASFMMFAENFFPVVKSEIYMAALMLTLFVFSAVMSGLIVLGYPVYIGMKGDIKKALVLIGWTSFFLFAFFVMGLGIGTYLSA